jgi:hypothetical protein
VTSNERKRQLMQDALDDMLSSEEEQELAKLLQGDPGEADHFSRLKRVDDLLNTAPHERAPRRLAISIMARLAETVKEQHALREETQINEATMQVAMALVTVAALPLLVGASWLLLNALSSPETLQVVLQQVTALFILIIEVMKVMIDEARALFTTNPEAAMALLALIPVTLLTIVNQVLGNAEFLESESNGDQGSVL